MLQKTKGIVLRTVKYKDTSVIADIYTEYCGRASFMVPVSRSRKATVKLSLFQPLALIELEADFSWISVIHPLLLGIIYILSSVLVLQFKSKHRDTV